jgi:hypothetical protein
VDNYQCKGMKLKTKNAEQKSKLICISLVWKKIKPQRHAYYNLPGRTEINSLKNEPSYKCNS